MLAQAGLAERAEGDEELVADPEVDVVYVATPHPQHLAIAREAIGRGLEVAVDLVGVPSVEPDVLERLVSHALDRHHPAARDAARAAGEPDGLTLLRAVAGVADRLRGW